MDCSSTHFARRDIKRFVIIKVVCVTRAMAAIGATSQSSVILSASLPGSTEILRCKSLGFDRNRNLYTCKLYCWCV